jgi:hypothetical protein
MEKYKQRMVSRINDIGISKIGRHNRKHKINLKVISVEKLPELKDCMNIQDVWMTVRTKRAER